MAQNNRNASYLFVIDGITVWERLRVVRNFLEDRRLAYEQNALNKKFFDKDKASEKELAEIELFKKQNETLIKECLDEIKFLENYEQLLSNEAEKTRIPGKTDEEMYEINYVEELVQINMLQVQSELMAVGHVSPETMKTLLKNRLSLNRAIELGLLNKDLLTLIGNTSYEPLSLYNDAKTLISFNGDIK